MMRKPRLSKKGSWKATGKATAWHQCPKAGRGIMVTICRIAYLHHHNIHLNLPSTNVLISICLRSNKNELVLMSQLFLRAVFYYLMRASSGALTLSVGLGFGYDGCPVAPSSRPWFGIAYVPSIARTSENDRSGGLQVSECPAGTSIQIPRFDHEALAVCRCSYHPASWNEMLTSYEVGSGTRWDGPSRCVRRLRRLLEEESAVRMLVGGGRVLIPRASALPDLVLAPVCFWTSVGGSSG